MPTSLSGKIFALIKQPLCLFFASVFQQDFRWLLHPSQMYLFNHTSTTLDLPAWLEFDLGSEQTFNSVTITENIIPNRASERITGLEFQAGNGTEYTTISTYSGTIGTSKTISLPETTSSKFKVLITGLQEDTTKNSKGQTDPSIQEIELYYR